MPEGSLHGLIEGRTAIDAAAHSKACRRMDVFDKIWNTCASGKQMIRLEISDVDLKQELENLGYKLKFAEGNMYFVCW